MAAAKAENETILKNSDLMKATFQSQVKDLENRLKAKIGEFDESKKDHAKFVKEVNDNSEDINLMRLRKTHAELKKEYNKLSESHKKEVDVVKKDKKRLEEELRVATLENRNVIDGQTTMNDLFKCMQEVIVKISAKEADNSANTSTTVIKYSCDRCDYEGESHEILEEHKKKSHFVNSRILYACEGCDEKFLNANSLQEHRRKKHKIQCDQCIFMANSKSELDDHMKRRHVILIKCTMCEITTDTQSKMSEHVKGFHNIKNYNCGKCDKFSNSLKK